MSFAVSKLKDLFLKRGNRLFLIHGDQEVTYGEFTSHWEHAAEESRRAGIQPFEPIAILSDYSPEALAHFFALAENRNIVVPIANHSDEETKKRLDVAKCRWTWSSQNSFQKNETHRSYRHHRLYRQLTDENRPGLVLFSSGTAGEPKAMLHDQDRLLTRYPPKPEKDLRQLLFLFFDHIGGFDTLFRAIANGSTLVIPKDRSPESVARLIATHQITILPTTPTFLNLILLHQLNETYDLSSLKVIAFGAEPMPTSLLNRLREAFPKVDFQQKFGTSETGAVQVISAVNDEIAFKIMDHTVEAKIEEGELYLKSSSSVLGYLNHPDPFTDDRWFPTGDLVEEQAEGAIRILGRKTEIINVGGNKVHPIEIEDVLLNHHAVIDARVYGKANTLTGQWVEAEVILDPDRETVPSKLDLKKHCSDSLDAYKVPAKIHFVDQVSQTANFKKKRS